MTIPFRRQVLLRRIERRLRRADPHLAAMLAIFAQLYMAEPITSAEYSTSRLARAMAAVAACARWALRRVAAVPAAVRRRSSRAAPVTGLR